MILSVRTTKGHHCSLGPSRRSARKFLRGWVSGRSRQWSRISSRVKSWGRSSGTSPTTSRSKVSSGMEAKRPKKPPRPTKLYPTSAITKRKKKRWWMAVGTRRKKWLAKERTALPSLKTSRTKICNPRRKNTFMCRPLPSAQMRTTSSPTLLPTRSPKTIGWINLFNRKTIRGVTR